MNKDELNNRLDEIYEECKESNWDSYNGLAIVPKEIEIAKHFLSLIPDNIPFPEPCPSPDGSISFDWYKGRYKIISLTINESNSLSYAWLNGSENNYDHDCGVIKFADKLPEKIVDKIKEIMELKP